MRRLNLTNKNSNEIYSLHFPKNLLGFIKFDFTVFMERSTDLCRLYMKTGAYKQEEVLEIRNSVSSCHKFVEQNIRGVFDKIVVDCWIEYICRLNEVGTVTLWNNFIPCRTDFEKVIFSRLSEYRHNTAINQWVNILKIQEYAKTKIEFVFGQNMKSMSEAVTRANYFDLMFNVAANELGYDVGEIAENRVYSLGRTPNSPFIMSNISREIVRSMFSDLKYIDDTKHKPKKGEFVADQTAMDAFSAIKAFIPSENDLALGTMIKALNESSQKVYIPASFKAVIDLEIDAIIDSGAILQRCGRCREFFLRSDEYNFDYCDRVNREGKSCIEIMRGSEHAPKKEKSVDSTLLSLRCDQLYREMSARVNVDLTQRDFSDWYKYMMIIREKVLDGEATIEDFDNFVEYSHAMTFIPQHRKEKEDEIRSETPPSRELHDERGRVVKPFVFEKVDRSEVKQPKHTVEEFTAEPHEQYSFRQPPVNPSAPRRVIRGVNAQTYENSFDSGPAVPYGGESFSRFVEEQPFVPQSVAQKPIVEPSYTIRNERVEEDIKIYNVKNETPEPKQEFVKVFEPTAKKSRSTHGLSISGNPDKAPVAPSVNRIPSVVPSVAASQSRTQSDTPSLTPGVAPNIALRDTAAVNTNKPAQIPQSATTENRNELLDDFLLKSAAAAEREAESKRNAETRKEQAPEVNNKPAKTPKSERAKKPENKISFAANAYKYTGVNTAAMKPGDSHASDNNEDYTPESEETAPPAFANTLLKNIERRDGFEDDEIPTDADGMPVSHKTKRVMDAIFKPSKPSLFININKDE